jgi:hypothetical protein
MMRSLVKLFLVLLTVTVICIGWIAGQLRSADFQVLILLLLAANLITFLIVNLWERKLEEKRRMERKSVTRDDPRPSGSTRRREASFALREKKSGLTWGGGNIKASEATRGTKRKFLGR